MSQARWTMFLVSVPALSPAVQASVTDRCTLQIGSLQSQTRCEIDSSLGACAIEPRAESGLTGDVELVLRSGELPVSGGQLDGGRCRRTSDLVGLVPAGIPGRPPALVVQLGSLAFAQRSRPFSCAPDGWFLADTGAEVVDGRLDVRVGGAESVSVPIVGRLADRSRSHGRLWIDGTGIHLLCAIENTIHVRVPEFDLGLRIAVRNVIRGDMDLPVPTRFCPARASAIQQLAHSAAGVAVRFSPSEEPLLVMHGTAREPRTLVPERLGPLPIPDETRSAAPRLPAPARQQPTGARWYFQFAYRDVLADDLFPGGSPGTVVDNDS